MATNPPITIGPFTNVPAPGSGVKSDWAQQITNYVNPGAWVAWPVTAPWTLFSSSSYQPLRYRKEGSIVRVSGALAPNAAASGSLAGTLPAGFRPAAVLEFPGTPSTATPIFMVVNAAGACNVYYPGGAGYVAFNFTFSTT